MSTWPIPQFFKTTPISMQALAFIFLFAALLVSQVLCFHNYVIFAVCYAEEEGNVQSDFNERSIYISAHISSVWNCGSNNLGANGLLNIDAYHSCIDGLNLDTPLYTYSNNLKTFDTESFETKGIFCEKFNRAVFDNICIDVGGLLQSNLRSNIVYKMYNLRFVVNLTAGFTDEFWTYGKGNYMLPNFLERNSTLVTIFIFASSGGILLGLLVYIWIKKRRPAKKDTKRKTRNMA